MAETFLGVILRSCTGRVSLSLPVIAFRLLREVFFRRDLIAYLVSHGVQFPLAAASYPFCHLLPPALVYTACPHLCFSCPSLCTAELPHLCPGVVPLGFASWGFPSGQVSCLVPLSPFHLHHLILSFPEHLVFCVVGVLPCLGCKLVRMISLFGGREWNPAVLETGAFFHGWSTSDVHVDLHTPPCQPPLKPQAELSCQCDFNSAALRRCITVQALRTQLQMSFTGRCLIQSMRLTVLIH